MTLVPLFFLTAVLYASVGFGGGSTYTALLLLADTDYRLVPLISLVCNILVVSHGTWRFYRSGHIDLRRIWPWVALSVPASFAGGLMPIREGVFIVLLAVCLLLSGLKMLLWPMSKKGDGSLSPADRPCISKTYVVPVVTGGGLGFLAGLTGIGGGIFLAPVLHFLRHSPAKGIAGTCSFFILVNSLAGVTGQFLKRGIINDIFLSPSQMLLFPAVVGGGVMGTWLATRRFDSVLITRLTALLILFVAVRLIMKIIFH